VLTSISVKIGRRMHRFQIRMAVSGRFEPFPARVVWHGRLGRASDARAAQRRAT